MEKFSNSLLWNFDEPQEKRKKKTFKFIKKLKKKMERKSFEVLGKNPNSNSIMIIVFPYHFEIK
jgi:hypothetical protein